MNSDIILSVENISKQYQLGVFGSGTIGGDVQRWWYKIRGKEDPFLKIGETNDRATKSNSKFVWALQDINFEVKRGEVLGIIGKNGAGKSTLLKLLSRVTGPTTGTIRSRGRMASLLEVGTGFHPELTGLENIYLNGAILGMTKVEIKRKLEEIIDFSGIARYIDTPVKRYSTGMTVRLGFAVAAFLEPEILVVDEVLAVGDAEFQKKAIGKMKEVSEGGGRTVLFVSHNMDSVRNLCNNGILLKDGMISYTGSANEVVDHYLSSNIDLSITDLINRNDREGSGQVLIESIDTISIDTNKTIAEVVTGMNIKLNVHYNVIDELLIGSKIEVGLVISSKSGHFITVFNNVMSNYKLVAKEKKGVVSCIIKNWPLTEGLFYIRSMIKHESTIYDIVEKAHQVFVYPGDFYRSGKVNSHGRQGVYIKQEWIQ